MTAQSTAARAATRRAGATSRDEVDWQAIDWHRVNQNVRRLQVRIVQATQEGRRGKVKALQRLLTHSFSGKALAVRRVTENRGKDTPGVDGETWDTPAKKATAIDALRQRGYRPRPLRRVYIPKKHGQRRPLGIPTLRDRAMQALYLLALAPIAETTGDPNSYGFREGRAAADALVQCHTVLARATSPRWVLEGDIAACFDRISHDWLLAHVPLDAAMLRKWLKAGYMERRVFYDTTAGTPQGGIISPVLANLALDGLEAALQRAFPRKGRKRGGTTVTAQVNLIRYADDFVITGRTKELLEREVRPLVVAFLRERGLALSPEKTLVTHIDDGFDFLGQTVRKYGGKVLITPSKDSVKRHLAAARAVIKANKQTPAGTLIAQLNPLIRGWAAYHRHQVSKRAFGSVDHAIFQALWRWAVRRHPNKGARWVKDKYFPTAGEHRWRFTGDTVDRDGKGRERHLFRAASVPITRHIKIRGAANPYDPAWESYFEARLGLKMETTLAGRRRLLHLWKRQAGRCSRCDRPIDTITGWHVHHVIWRSRGGGDHAANLTLLHPTCHSQAHAREGPVPKPRPSLGGVTRGLSRVRGNSHARF
jgi:RNA-directed DNA polymerase